ncbi:MAG: hypothetical protein H7A38_01710 [Chlamydiales bacterium]|nr:hypothetical protein [Chlamydiales bacterium]
MIQRATLIAFILLALFTGGVLFEAFYAPQSATSIEELLTQDISMPKNEEKYPNKQMRSGVSKDLWIANKEGGRLHHHIESPRSILTAVQKGSQIELTEQMINMRCFLQEKIEDDDGKLTQNIRYFQSSEGTYRYSDQLFNAHSVFLALYSLPGDTLTTTLDPSTAFLKGVADEVSLSFSNGSPNFQAEKFKAHIRPQEERR